MNRLPSKQYLYHWAPAHSRTLIWNQGLLISQPESRGLLDLDGQPWRAPWLCFGISPHDAWAWGNLPPGLYDCWQITRDPSDKVICRRDGGTEIIEVRIHNNISPDRLWRVGEYLKETPIKRVRKT